jgi:hypothetical protein
MTEEKKETVTIIKCDEITLQEYLPEKRLVIVARTEDTLMLIPAKDCLNLLEKHKEEVLGKKPLDRGVVV